MTLRATLSPYAVEADPAEFLAKALGKGRNIEPAELNLTLSNLGVPDESSSPPAELSKYELPVSAGLRPSPTVSLYIPAYNAAAFLPRTLPSVFAQSVKPAEVLLIDDGSTDETASIGKTFPLRVVKHPQNLGLAAARNTALREAKSDLIACLDSDVAPDRYWLERLLSPLDDPRVAGVTGRLVEQHTCAIADRWRARMMAQHYGHRPVSNQPIFGCNGIFRRQTALSIGGYQEKYRRSYEDMEFSRRLLGAGYETRYVPSALCRHQRQDSLRSVVDTCFQWRLPYLEEIGAFYNLTAFAGAMATNLRHDLKELEELFRTGDEELSFPSLLMLLRSPLKMLKEAAKHGLVSGSDSIFAWALTCTAKTLDQLKISDTTRALLIQELEDSIEALETTEAFSSLQMRSRDYRSLQEQRAALPQLAASLSLGAASVLESLPDVVRFPDGICQAFDMSARLSARKFSLSARLAIQVVPGKGCDTENLRPKLDFPSLALRVGHDTAFDCFERVCGAEPSEGVIIAESHLALPAIAWAIRFSRTLARSRWSLCISDLDPALAQSLTESPLTSGIHRATSIC